MDLGRVGVWTLYRNLGEENAASAAALAEQLGFGALWLGGSPRLPSVRPLLEGSERLVVATGVVNVWRYDPAQLASEYAELEGDFPGRLLVGIGIGHPEATSEYSSPLATMRSFLDGLDGAPVPVPSDRRCLAALGPKMLELSAHRSLGTHPYFTAPEHTRAARARLGPSRLVGPELACVIDQNGDSASATARAYAKRYLSLSNYRNSLLTQGFEERDLDEGGSEQLIDAVIPQGSPATIASVAREHFDAGADHVCLQTLGVTGIPREQWTALAHELL
jgi:probable F420-dependent oxidoreductase